MHVLFAFYRPSSLLMYSSERPRASDERTVNYGAGSQQRGVASSCVNSGPSQTNRKIKQMWHGFFVVLDEFNCLSLSFDWLYLNGCQIYLNVNHLRNRV